VAQLVTIVREIVAETADGGIAAARFRDRIGVGRKLAIQILEFFDASGVTRRTGDVHHLR
jgi:selenocysteine-specific elongation factor